MNAQQKQKRRTVSLDGALGVSCVISKHGNVLGTWMRNGDARQIVAVIPKSRKNHGVRISVFWLCVTDDFGSLVKTRYA